jgi:dethiobiotin synthetase
MTIFVTGIGTNVGKTIASAIITEALEADYWKPIQAGDLDQGDAHQVQKLISNQKTVFHPNIYALNTPASPHYAAQIDGVKIDIEKIIRPRTENNLVIEGAGGLLVPLNDTKTILDLIQPADHVVIVSRHYLGSINHTLLTYEVLKQNNINVLGVVFSGDEYPSTESIILQKTNWTMLFRINEEPYFDKNVVKYYADLAKENLQAIKP